MYPFTDFALQRIPTIIIILIISYPSSSSVLLQSLLPFLFLPFGNYINTSQILYRGKPRISAGKLEKKELRKNIIRYDTIQPLFRQDLWYSLLFRMKCRKESNRWVRSKSISSSQSYDGPTNQPTIHPTIIIIYPFKLAAQPQQYQSSNHPYNFNGGNQIHRQK